MAKKQTRRSISVRGTTYVELRDFCERTKQSMSEFIEDRIAEHLAKHKAEAPRASAPSPPTTSSRLAYCALCGARGPSLEALKHAPSCPRARRPPAVVPPPRPPEKVSPEKRARREVIAAAAKGAPFLAKDGKVDKALVDAFNRSLPPPRPPVTPPQPPAEAARPLPTAAARERREIERQAPVRLDVDPPRAVKVAPRVMPSHLFLK